MCDHTQLFTKGGLNTKDSAEQHRHKEARLNAEHKNRTCTLHRCVPVSGSGAEYNEHRYKGSAHNVISAENAGKHFGKPRLNKAIFRTVNRKQRQENEDKDDAEQRTAESLDLHDNRAKRRGFILRHDPKGKHQCKIQYYSENRKNFSYHAEKAFQPEAVDKPQCPEGGDQHTELVVGVEVIIIADILADAEYVG